LSLCWVLRGEGRPSETQESKSFAFQPGDTLVVQNDYGRVAVRSWQQPGIEARIRRVTATGAGHVRVVSDKRGDKIFVYAFFADTPGESVDVEVQAPPALNVVIQGANPEIELSGIQGYVRVHTFTGAITAEDLTSSVSLLSERGDIVLNARAQSTGDVRLESASGSVACRFGKNLNARVWARAGGMLQWGASSQGPGASLEKQIGNGGPLIYAASLRGDVRIEVDEAVAPAPPGARVDQARGQPGVEPAGRERPAAPPQIQTADAPPKISPTNAEPAEGARNPAPPATASDDGAKPTFKVKVNSVYLNVSVRDRATNRSIPGLRRDDFLVYEDGIEQQVDQFETTDAPFHLLLLLDVSGSTRSFISLIHRASVDFTREISPEDRIAVAAFNSRVRLVQQFTSDRAEVASSIEALRSGGGTAFYDALETAVDSYMRGIEGRKAIVVFTDGVDNQLEGNRGQGSHISFEQLYRRIQEADIMIYPIFLDTEGDVPVSRQPRSRPPVVLPGSRRGWPLPWPLPVPTPTPSPTPAPRGGGVPGRRATYQAAREQLQLIADQTGGRMYSPQRIEHLSNAYSEIADDLRIQYGLAYNSTNTAQDGRWREIKVRIKSQPDTVARTRKGYYAGRDRASMP